MKHAQPPRIIAGKYQLVEPLSRGGMGSVWLAQHLDLDAPVAVKFMHSSLSQDKEARARFQREAKAAAQIRSPYVVHIYDHGIDAGAPYIVMEYLEGEDLGERLRRMAPLPVDEVVRICVQICKGLYPAHRLGIVHRDLKPGNVFLVAEADDMVKLLDFGIAKETGTKRLVKSEGTTTGQLLGSPQYLSPEQARGFSVDQRSDLWSVAVILFRALTGKRPFDADDMGDLIVRICMDPIPRAQELRPELPETLDEFFSRALSRDVDDRYPDAKQFAQAFAAAAHGPSSQREIPSAIVDEPSASSWESAGALPPLGLAVADAATRLTPPSLSRGADAPSMPTGHSGGTLGPTLTPATPTSSRRRLAGAASAAVAVVVLGIMGFRLLTSPTGSPAADTSGSASEPAPEPADASLVSPTAAASAEPTAEAANGGSAGATASAAATASADATAEPTVTKPHARPPPAWRPHPKPRRTSSPPKPLPDIGY